MSLPNAGQTSLESHKFVPTFERQEFHSKFELKMMLPKHPKRLKLITRNLNRLLSWAAHVFAYDLAYEPEDWPWRPVSHIKCCLLSFVCLQSSQNIFSQIMCVHTFAKFSKISTLRLFVFFIFAKFLKLFSLRLHSLLSTRGSRPFRRYQTQNQIVSPALALFFFSTYSLSLFLSTFSSYSVILPFCDGCNMKMN